MVKCEDTLFVDLVGSLTFVMGECIQTDIHSHTS